MVAADRTQELKNFEYEEKLYNLDRALLNYVTKEEQALELRDKVSIPMLEELRESFHKL